MDSRVAGVGLVTPWGTGVAALPVDAAAAAGERRCLACPPPPITGERFRRATRECLLGVAAIEALLADAGLERAGLAGSETALLYVTAAAYGAANRQFIESAGRALHFPYTAPSAVPAEVAIEFGLTGAYTIMIGGAPATLEALWYATTLLDRGECARAVVLAVETFDECADLWARGRALVPGPLVEAAGAVLLGPGRPVAMTPGPVASSLEAASRRRAGETLAVAPIVGLALGRASADRSPLAGGWRGRRTALAWSD